MTMLSVSSYCTVFIDDLNCERYPHLWVVIVGDLLSPLSYHGGEGERKMENACGQRFLFFLGPLVSFLSTALKA